LDCDDGKTVVVATSDPRTAVVALRLQAVTFDVANAIEAAAFWSISAVASRSEVTPIARAASSQCLRRSA